MSLIPKHISFDNIVFPELKLDRRPVMKVREWLKIRRAITSFKTIPPSLEKRVFSIETEKIDESDVAEYVEKIKSKISDQHKEIKPEYGIQFEIIDGKVVSKTVKLHEKR
jgi:hypothetical protein